MQAIRTGQLSIKESNDAQAIYDAACPAEQARGGLPSSTPAADSRVLAPGKSGFVTPVWTFQINRATSINLEKSVDPQNTPKSRKKFRKLLLRKATPSG